jgi:hypothetical protein
MRRILLGGLGIALGVFASPALAQQPNPPARGAAFGRPAVVGDAPTAVPAAAPTDPGVTPVGLFRNGPAQATVVQSPPGYAPSVPVMAQPPAAPGAPVYGTPVYGTPVYGAPVYGGPAAGTPAVATVTPGGVPPVGPGGVPMVMPGGVPMVTPGGPAPLANPRPVPGAPPTITEVRDPTGRIPGGTIVPSVGPDPFECPDPGLEDPLCDGHRLGLHRLAGCGRTWVSAELLMWWNRSAPVPALITTSSPAANGIVGRGDTHVLLGGSFGSTYHSGGRIGAGYWFSDDQYNGIDGRLFWVIPATASFQASVPPYALLARPFFNVNPHITTPNVPLGPSSEVVAGPGVATGTVLAQLRSTVWGAEMNYRRFLFGNACNRLDALVGYRYIGVSESLTVSEAFNRIPGSMLQIGVPAVSGTVTDQIRTTNHFNGGQIGLAGTLTRGRWSVDGRSTIAFGTVSQSASIDGAQTLHFADGTTQMVHGGLLAVNGANIGHWTQNRFAVAPEVGINLGYQLTSHMKVFVGYNFLYLSSAVRPGGAIDPYIDAARVPNLLPPGSNAVPVTPVRPMPQLTTSGYFVQGISFGLVYRW